MMHRGRWHLRHPKAQERAWCQGARTLLNGTYHLVDKVEDATCRSCLYIAARAKGPEHGA